MFLGVDGDQYLLPRSKDILDRGYSGFPINENEEAYGLSMYAVIATELMTGAPVAFVESNHNDEISKACTIVADSTKREVYVYDRLYYSEKLIRQHIKNDSKFVFRLKGSGIPVEIKEFFESDISATEIVLYGIKIRLIRGFFDSEGNQIIIATNLPLGALRLFPNLTT